MIDIFLIPIYLPAGVSSQPDPGRNARSRSEISAGRNIIRPDSLPNYGRSVSGRFFSGRK